MTLSVITPPLAPFSAGKRLAGHSSCTIRLAPITSASHSGQECQLSQPPAVNSQCQEFHSGCDAAVAASGHNLSRSGRSKDKAGKKYTEHRQVQTRTHAPTHTRARARAHTHTHTHTHARTRTHMHARAHTHARARTHARTHAHTRTDAQNTR